MHIGLLVNLIVLLLVAFDGLLAPLLTSAFFVVTIGGLLSILGFAVLSIDPLHASPNSGLLDQTIEVLFEHVGRDDMDEYRHAVFHDVRMGREPVERASTVWLEVLLSRPLDVLEAVFRLCLS